MYKIPFFQLSNTAVIRVCSLLKHICVRESVVDPSTGTLVEHVFKRGEVGVQFYIVMGGTSAIEQEDEDAESREVGPLKAGDFFGELAVLAPLVAESTRKRSAWAGEDSGLATLSYDDLAQLRLEDPYINAAMKSFMEEVAVEYAPAGLTNIQRYPDQNVFLHDRIDGLEAKMDGMAKKLDQL